MLYNKRTSERGVTLTVLVVTISIMLILVGIVFQGTLKGGLLQKKEDIKQDTQNMIENTEEKMNSLSNQWPDVIGDTGTTNQLYTTIVDYYMQGKIHTGDYVSYTPKSGATISEATEQKLIACNYNNTDQTYNKQITQDTTLKWRVLDVKDGYVRLISNKITNSQIMIDRMNGYNNAVNTLNNICKDLYSGSLGTAQSVDIEDLEMHLKSSYLNSRKGTHNVGVEKSYSDSSCTYYPSISLKEKTMTIDGNTGKLGISEQGDGETITDTVDNGKAGALPTNRATIMYATQTSWNGTPAVSDFEDYNSGTGISLFRDLFFNYKKSTSAANSTSYYFASRGTNLNAQSVSYQIFAMNKGVYNQNCTSSDGQISGGNAFGMLPVVTLKSNLTLQASNSADGSEANPWVLVEF